MLKSSVTIGTTKEALQTRQHNQAVAQKVANSGAAYYHSQELT
jgi:hypothetical protein